MPQRARPGRPAASGHELAAVARVRAGVLVEVLAAQAQDLLQPGFVGLHERLLFRLGELGLEQRPQRPFAVVASRRREAVIREGAVPVFAHASGVLEAAVLTRAALI